MVNNREEVFPSQEQQQQEEVLPVSVQQRKFKPREEV